MMDGRKITKLLTMLFTAYMYTEYPSCMLISEGIYYDKRGVNKEEH